MTNLPPEHKSYDPEDPDEGATGIFPAVDPTEILLPPSLNPSAEEAGIDNSGPAFFAPKVSPQPPLPPGQYSPPDSDNQYVPDQGSTGQYPAFVDSRANASDPDPGFVFPADAEEPRASFETPEKSLETSEISQVEAEATLKRPETYAELESTGVVSAAIAPPQRPSGSSPTFEQDAASSLPSGEIILPTDDDDADTRYSDSDVPARVRRRLAQKGQPQGKIQRIRSERDSDSGWTYLSILGLIFVLLIGFSWGCSRLSDADQTAARNSQFSTELAIKVQINGDQVSVSGTLPDEDTANSLIAKVGEHYESSAIINNMTIDEAISSDDSSIQLVGQAEVDDNRPGDLADALTGDFDIPLTANSVLFGTLQENLVSIAVEIAGNSVTVTGTVPDQAKLDLVKGAAESTWGADQVDSSGLVIADVQWSGGRITVGGDVLLGSVTPGQFAQQVRIDGIFVDPGTTAEDLDNATPDQIKEAIAQQLTNRPIKFAEGSLELSEGDKVTLDGVATLLILLPEDQPIKILGYGDGGSDSAEALELGKERAGGVWGYLITSKNVSESIDFSSASGASDSQIAITFE